jgi:hypothetical protein
MRMGKVENVLSRLSLQPKKFKEQKEGEGRRARREDVFESDDPHSRLACPHRLALPHQCADDISLTSA